MDKAKIYSRATALAAAQTPAKKFRFGDLAAILTVAVVGIFVAYHFSPANAAASVRSAAQSFISTDLAKALQSYKDDTGSFPNGRQGLQALLEEPANVANWKGPYLAAATALRDPWNMPYQYSNPSRHNGVGKYDAWSMGPDKQNGSADDVNNW